MINEAATAHTVMERCDILGEISEEAGCLTRPFRDAGHAASQFDGRGMDAGGGHAG